LITDEKRKLNPAGSASIMVQKYLRPAAIKARVIKEDIGAICLLRTTRLPRE
jgi:hypothetical protein